MRASWSQPIEIQSFTPDRLADERSTPVEERSFGALASRNVWMFGEERMADEVEALKARRKNHDEGDHGDLRSSDPRTNHTRASLTRQIDLLDRKIREALRQA